MTSSTPHSPQLFFDAVFSFQRTAAAKAAIDLEIFTAIHEGNNTGFGRSEIYAVPNSKEHVVITHKP